MIEGQPQIVERPMFITDFFGKQVYELRAPFAGEALYILGTPPVSKGEPLRYCTSVPMLRVPI